MLSPDFVGLRSQVNASVMQDRGTEGAGPRLLTVKEAAARLRVSPATVYGLCERGGLRYVRISTHAIRITEADLSTFVHRRRSDES
jgi:excisionase family DNA binding protein